MTDEDPRGPDFEHLDKPRQPSGLFLGSFPDDSVDFRREFQDQLERLNAGGLEGEISAAVRSQTEASQAAREGFLSQFGDDEDYVEPEDPLLPNYLEKLQQSKQGLQTTEPPRDPEAGDLAELMATRLHFTPDTRATLQSLIADETLYVMQCKRCFDLAKSLTDQDFLFCQAIALAQGIRLSEVVRPATIEVLAKFSYAIPGLNNAVRARLPLPQVFARFFAPINEQLTKSRQWFDELSDRRESSDVTIRGAWENGLSSQPDPIFELWMIIACSPENKMVWFIRDEENSGAYIQLTIGDYAQRTVENQICFGLPTNVDDYIPTHYVYWYSRGKQYLPGVEFGLTRDTRPKSSAASTTTQSTLHKHFSPDQSTPKQSPAVTPKTSPPKARPPPERPPEVVEKVEEKGKSISASTRSSSNTSPKKSKNPIKIESSSSGDEKEGSPFADGEPIKKKRGRPPRENKPKQVPQKRTKKPIPKLPPPPPPRPPLEQSLEQPEEEEEEENCIVSDVTSDDDSLAAYHRACLVGQETRFRVLFGTVERRFGSFRRFLRTVVDAAIVDQPRIGVITAVDEAFYGVRRAIRRITETNHDIFVTSCGLLDIARIYMSRLNLQKCPMERSIVDEWDLRLFEKVYIAVRIAGTYTNHCTTYGISFMIPAGRYRIPESATVRDIVSFRSYICRTANEAKQWHCGYFEIADAALRSVGLHKLLVTLTFLLTSRSATPLFRRTIEAIDYKPVMETLWGPDWDYPSDEGPDDARSDGEEEGRSDVW
jgi:hypothetical protein